MNNVAFTGRVTFRYPRGGHDFDQRLVDLDHLRQAIVQGVPKQNITTQYTAKETVQSYIIPNKKIAGFKAKTDALFSKYPEGFAKLFKPTFEIFDPAKEKIAMQTPVSLWAIIKRVFS